MAGIKQTLPKEVVHKVRLYGELVEAVLTTHGVAYCSNCMFAGNPVDCSVAGCDATSRWVPATDYTRAKLLGEAVP